MYFVQFFSRSQIRYGVALFAALVLGVTSTTVALADDSAAVAQVLVVVVEAPNGDWVITDKGEAPKVRITRAPGGCSETTVVRKGVPLCKGDHVITAAGAKVKIAFGDPKDKDELTIGAGSDVTISSANCSFVCRWFGSWKNRYTNRTPHTSYTNEGTVYEVKSEQDGSGELLVYEGRVQVKKIDNAPATPSTPETPDPAETPEPVDTPEPAETPEPTPDGPLTESGGMIVGRLRRVTISPDGTPGEAEAVTYAELSEALAFSSDVEIASHNNPAEAGGNFAKFVNFVTITERKRAFRKARVDSFWEPQQFRPYLTLGEVYNDWGDSEQALAYLSKALELCSRSLQACQEIDELTTNKALALRQTGNYEDAQTELNKVIAKTGSSYGVRALNIRGSIFYDQARKVMLTSQTDEVTAEAEALLQQAEQEYEKAEQLRPTQLDLEYLRVNKAQVSKAQGDIQKRRGQYPAAGLSYIRAIAGIGAAYGRVDNPSNKIAGLLVARAYAAMADAEAAMGNSTESFRSYGLAEKTYKASIAEAERQGQKFAHAYCGLASLYLIIGDEKARENYDRCVTYNIAALVTETDVPKVVGLRRPHAIQLLAEAGLEPEIVADGETVETQEPLTGKIKIGTKVKLTLSIAERE